MDTSLGQCGWPDRDTDKGQLWEFNQTGFLKVYI